MPAPHGTEVASGKTRRGPNYDIGEFDPAATVVQLSGGGTSTVEAAVADLGPAAGTRAWRCPFHADGKPSAWLARTHTGEPMLACSTCTTVWFPVRPSPDVASMEVPPGAENPRYMADVALKSPVTVLHADTGSGKTRQLERIVQEVLDGAGRVLAVVHRKSLARALARRLGLTDYRAPRIALGGVAHKPWRVPAAEALLQGQAPSDERFARAAERVLEGAVPLAHNGFKIELARRAIIRALLDATAGVQP